MDQRVERRGGLRRSSHGDGVESCFAQHFGEPHAHTGLRRAVIQFGMGARSMAACA